MKKYRILQLLFFIHRIHHISYSYGYKLAFLPIGYFDKFGFKFTNKHSFKTKSNKYVKGYHNCTLTGVY